jgi:superfamily I DNA/RNA helicase
MAFLRLLVDPDDDLALARIANVPPRGISAPTVQAARAGAAEAGTSVWRELLALRERGKLSPAALGGLAALERLVGLRHASPPTEPGRSRGAAVLRRLLDDVGYRQYLDKEYADDPAEAETRWACCEEVAAALDEHERGRAAATELAAVIRGFLDDFVLQVEEQEDRFKDDKPKGDVVRLMTLHAAKGLEFDCVWMVGMEEGILPHHRSLGDGLQAID